MDPPQRNIAMRLLKAPHLYETPQEWAIRGGINRLATEHRRAMGGRLNCVMTGAQMQPSLGGWNSLLRELLSGLQQGSNSGQVWDQEGELVGNVTAPFLKSRCNGG